MCVGFCLQLLSETFLILRITDRDIINAHMCSWKYPLLLDFKRTWIFSTDFREMFNINFHENPTVGVELYHADGRTDMTKLILAFRNFEKASTNGCIAVSYFGNTVGIQQQ